LKKKDDARPTEFFLPADMAPDELAEAVRKLVLHGLIKLEGERWVMTARGHQVLTNTPDKRV
jgi:hypothetical protein